MEPAPQHSPALQRALELREEGKSLRVIAGILEAEAVPKPGRIKKWSAKAVARLFDPPSPSTTPDPAPVEIPAPADAVLMRLAGQIAELEELNEERQALDREAREQLAAGQEAQGQGNGVLGRLVEQEKQQQAQRAEQLAEQRRWVERGWELWNRRWKDWWKENWRLTLVPACAGLVLGGLFMLGVVGGKLGWEAVKSLFR